jgi:phosphatidylserine/phosphatidylglycerophosphate/cardiolipin synthase-like enzyme
MGRIISARAYANNEVAYLAWWLDGPIEGCLGFDITRIYPSSGEERPLATWVPFKGQVNPQWLAQSTRVWPVQKLTWRDLTVRKRRDRLARRVGEDVLQYRIRPVVRFRPGLEAVPADAEAPPYEGHPLPLAYAGKGYLTNSVQVTRRHGDITATFTNGILSAQWLKKALQEQGETLTQEAVLRHMSTPGDAIREYLTGDVKDLLKELLERTALEAGSKLHLALYELWDEELVDLIGRRQDSVRLILTNSSKDKSGGWDAHNAQTRQALHPLLGSEMTDRMFNNEHIGHNKFAVFCDANGVAKVVLTGSTNWTPTGLCGQSNNALLIQSEPLAAAYLDYWQGLASDTEGFVTPQPLSAPTRNVQGARLRAANATKRSVRLSDGTEIGQWRAPNTRAKKKGAQVPPDLAEVYDLLGTARDAIFFAVFLPSQSGRASVIEEVIRIGKVKPGLIVQGCVSDVMAMPNYIAPVRGAHKKRVQPAAYDNGNVHLVRAVALNKDDIVGSFESELLAVGKATIHDKIMVIDPLSDNCTLIVGSHNLGFKASYENDENLLIIRGNRPLAEAYMVHVLDVYEHYRYRALQRELKDNGKPLDGGVLSTDDHWLTQHLGAERGALARYLSGANSAAPMGDAAAAGQGRKATSIWGRLFGRR